jgi:hypothetical protein
VRSDDTDDAYWQQMMLDLSRKMIRGALRRTQIDRAEGEPRRGSVPSMRWATPVQQRGDAGSQAGPGSTLMRTSPRLVLYRSH